MKCYACSNVIERGESLICKKCNHTYLYHYKCLNITTATFLANNIEYNRSWLCQPCQIEPDRKNRNDETPIKVHSELPMTQKSATPMVGLHDDPRAIDKNLKQAVTVETTTCPVASQSIPTTSSSSPSISLEQFEALLNMKLDTKLENIRVSLAEEIKRDFRDLITKMEVDFKRTTDSLSVEITDVRRDIADLSNVVQSLKNENLQLHSDLDLLRCKQTNTSDTSQLEETISQLQCHINDREQQDLLNDVEITGIPR